MENKIKKRKYEIVVEIESESREEAEKMIREKFDVVSIKCLKDFRSVQQNRALYLFFRLLAESLNDAGYDMKKTIRQEIDISWTPESIKQYLWLPIMKTMTGKTSTAKMKKDDLDKIYEVLNKTIGERTGVFVPFPSIENLREYKI